MVGLGIQLSTFDIILTFIREQGVGVWQGLWGFRAGGNNAFPDTYANDIWGSGRRLRQYVCVRWRLGSNTLEMGPRNRKRKRTTRTQAREKEMSMSVSEGICRNTWLPALLLSVLISRSPGSQTQPHPQKHQHGEQGLPRRPVAPARIPSSLLETCGDKSKKIVQIIQKRVKNRLLLYFF